MIYTLKNILILLYINKNRINQTKILNYIQYIFFSYVIDLINEQFLLSKLIIDLICFYYIHNLYPTQILLLFYSIILTYPKKYLVLCYIIYDIIYDTIDINENENEINND